MDGSARGVQGHGREADVGPPRKLHPNGETGPTSFTEMTGFKAVRLAVVRWMSAGVQTDPWLLGGQKEGRKAAQRRGWRLQHWPGEGDGGLDGAGMAGREHSHVESEM